MLTYRTFSTNQAYVNALETLLKLEEGASIPLVKDIGDGAATIGYGYTFNRNDNVSIWKQSGITTLSASDWAALAVIDKVKIYVGTTKIIDKVATYARETAIALSSFHHQLTSTEAQELLRATEPTYEARVTKWLAGIQPSVERTALVSLAYNGLINIGISTTLQQDIVNGNRAEAWYEIRYDSNGDKAHANRRYLEAYTFSLYNDSTHLTQSDAEQVGLMYTAHHDAILQYEKTYNPLKADTNYAITSIQDIYHELQPAISELKSVYGIASSVGLKELQISSSTQEDLTGGKSNDLLIGDANNNVFIEGSGGNDVLIGNAGIDTVDLHLINDNLIINLQGLSGTSSFNGTISDTSGSVKFTDKLLNIETINLGTGNNIVTFEQSKIGMVVNSPDHAGNITISGNVTKYLGSNYGDRIKGGDNGVEFHDGSGNDIIIGGTGNDKFYAGSGNDLYYSNGGNDAFIFSSNSGIDAVDNFTTSDSVSIDGRDLSGTTWYSIVLFGGLYWHTADNFFKLYTDYHSIRIDDPNGNQVYLMNAVDNHVFNPGSGLFGIV